MRIENEMLSRFANLGEENKVDLTQATLSEELDFFFDNVMDSVVDYFKEKVIV